MKTPLATALGFLAILVVIVFYGVLFSLRGIDVKSCQRQIVPRQVQRDFLRSDALFQRGIAATSGERPEANRARTVVAARWEHDATRIVIPSCHSNEIPYPWPF